MTLENTDTMDYGMDLLVQLADDDCKQIDTKIAKDLKVMRQFMDDAKTHLAVQEKLIDKLVPIDLARLVQQDIISEDLLITAIISIPLSLNRIVQILKLLPFDTVYLLLMVLEEEQHEDFSSILAQLYQQYDKRQGLYIDNAKRQASSENLAQQIISKIDKDDGDLLSFQYYIYSASRLSNFLDNLPIIIRSQSALLSKKIPVFRSKEEITRAVKLSYILTIVPETPSAVEVVLRQLIEKLVDTMAMYPDPKLSLSILEHFSLRSIRFALEHIAKTAKKQDPKMLKLYREIFATIPKVTAFKTKKVIRRRQLPYPK